MSENNNVCRRCTTRNTKEGSLSQTVDVEITRTDSSKAVERVQNYGFASVPADEANGIVISIGGQRIVICLDHLADRPKDLAVGEVAVWHKNGDIIQLKNNNEIHVKTTLFKVDGDIEASGEIRSSTGVTGPNVDLETHTHAGDSGGTTGEPN